MPKKTKQAKTQIIKTDLELITDLLNAAYAHTQAKIAERAANEVQMREQHAVMDVKNWIKPDSCYVAEMHWHKAMDVKFETGRALDRAAEAITKPADVMLAALAEKES